MLFGVSPQTKAAELKSKKSEKFARLSTKLLRCNLGGNIEDFHLTFFNFFLFENLKIRISFASLAHPCYKCNFLCVSPLQGAVSPAPTAGPGPPSAGRSFRERADLRATCAASRGYNYRDNLQGRPRGALMAIPDGHSPSQGARRRHEQSPGRSSLYSTSERSRCTAPGNVLGAACPPVGVDGGVTLLRAVPSSPHVPMAVRSEAESMSLLRGA